MKKTGCTIQDIVQASELANLAKGLYSEELKKRITQAATSQKECLDSSTALIKNLKAFDADTHEVGKEMRISLKSQLIQELRDILEAE